MYIFLDFCLTTSLFLVSFQILRNVVWVKNNPKTDLQANWKKNERMFGVIHKKKDNIKYNIYKFIIWDINYYVIVIHVYNTLIYIKSNNKSFISNTFNLKVT